MASYLGLQLPFNEEQIKDYVNGAKDYALRNGLVMRTASDPVNPDIASHVTLTLLPSPMPKNVFEDLRQIQIAYLELYHAVAHDFEFLEEQLKPIVAFDDFIRGLWNIHLQVKDRPPNQHRCLCLARNDFMLHQSGSSLVPKQIEINSIAASFGGLGTRLRGYHGHLLATMGCGDMKSKMPESRLDENFADAMIKAVKLYNTKNCVIMFVVEETNRNVYDQRYLEDAVYRREPELKVIWRSLREIDARGRLDKDERLFVDDHEVAVVYFRSAYIPQLFHGDIGWRVRLMVEKSRSILAPCIHMQLAGCKKVQQALCAPGAVEKYITDPNMAARIRRTFAQQYPTDQTPEGDAAVKLVQQNPDNYVLKSQREGGGNNFYGQSVVDELEKLKESGERGKYVLMERVRPPAHDNYILVAGGEVKYGKTISEVGMYVSSIWNGGTTESSKYCGQFYRTKMEDMDEGGVMIGIAAIDSLLFV